MLMQLTHGAIAALLLLFIFIVPILPRVVALTFEDQYQLTSFGSQPALSPDGRDLIFVSYSTFGPASYPTEIWSIGIDGSNPRLVTTTPDDMQASNLQFSPDGGKISYIGEKLDGSRSIHVVDRNGNIILQGKENAGTFTWSSNETIIYTVQEAENSVSFYQLSLDSSSATFLSRITMADASRFVVAGNMVLTNEGRNLLFTAFGVGQAKSDIFSLDLETGEVQKFNGLEDLFMIDLGRDENTVFVGQGSGYSITLYSAELDQPTEKTTLLEGNLGYSIYESQDKELVVAYAYAPGGSAPFDAHEWSRFGVHVACQDGCGPKPVVFSDGYIVKDGQYVKNDSNNIFIIATVISIVAGAGIFLYTKKIRQSKQIP